MYVSEDWRGFFFLCALWNYYFWYFMSFQWFCKSLSKPLILTIIENTLILKQREREVKLFKGIQWQDWLFSYELGFDRYCSEPSLISISFIIGNPIVKTVQQSFPPPHMSATTLVNPWYGLISLKNLSNFELQLLAQWFCVKKEMNQIILTFFPLFSLAGNFKIGKSNPNMHRD